MRTYLYRPACFLALLITCLMFAPARLVTGDRSIYSVPLSDPPTELSAAAGDRPFADLCRDDPVAALASSLQCYRSKVEGYSCTFIKQERVNGKMRNREVIRCQFRESPFSVRMEWLEGAGRANVMLYPAGDRTDRLAIVPSSQLARAALSYVTRGINDSSVRAASRYPVNEFGIKNGVTRLHNAWQLAKERGILKTRYEGIRPIPELGGRPCHVLHRDCVYPEEDGITAITVFFDAETLLQAGAVLKSGEELVATYYFRDFVINPAFDAKRFAVESLK